MMMNASGEDFVPMKSLMDELARLYSDIDFNALPPVEEPVYQCEVCKDLGRIRFDVPFGDPRFGKMCPCTNPNCARVKRDVAEWVERIAQSPDWEADYGTWTFESFRELVAARFELVKGVLDAETRKQGAEGGKRGAYAAAVFFARSGGWDFTMNEAVRKIYGDKFSYPGKNPDRPANSVVFRGEVGLGKTSLAVSATNDLRAAGHGVVYARLQSILRRIQESYNKASNTESLDDVLRYYSSTPFLVIDEFELENYADDRKEKVEEIIRTRDRKHLPSLLTTNLTLNECYAKWGKRTADVVAKAHWVPVAGIKLRLTASQEDEVIW